MVSCVGESYGSVILRNWVLMINGDKFKVWIFFFGLWRLVG